MAVQLPSPEKMDQRGGSLCEDSLLSRLVVGALACLLLALISYNYIDVDVWHEMALIRASLRAGHLLTHDVFAYTPTLSPVVHHEWGAGVVAYLVTGWFGGTGLVLLKDIIALATILVCVGCARAQGVDLRVFAFLGPVGVYLVHAGFLSTIRAQAFTFLFTAVFLYCLTQDRRGRRSWILPWLLISLIWVNVHGGFVVGVGLAILHLVEEVIDRRPYRHLLVVTAAMCLESLITPYGAAYISYLSHALTMPRPHISEWAWSFGRGTTWSLFVTASLIVAVCTWALSSQRSSKGVLVLLATAAQGIMHFKLLPLFGIAWLCYVPGYVQSTRVGQWTIAFMQRRKAFMRAALIAMIVVTVVTSIRQKFWVPDVPQGPKSISYPVGAVQYLRTNAFAGNMLVPYASGAYVSWKTEGRVRVSVDSRYEVAYAEELVDEMFAFYEASPGWLNTLSKYPTDAVLVPNESEVAKQMSHTGWERVYTDREYQIHAKPGTGLPVQDFTSSAFRDVIP